MKYSPLIGIVAAIILTASCFMPWAYYPNFREEFTGFYSHANVYGRPGKVLIFFSILSVCFFLIPRIWAKRANFIVVSLAIAFAIKSFLLFISCYSGTCPSARPGIFIMLGSVILMLVAAVLPKLPVKEEKKEMR
jgi:hypothetical protein